MSETKTTHTVHFTYDPLFLTRTLMQIHIEKYFDTEEGEEETKAFRFASFDFMRTMSDAELESILDAFAEKEGYEEITFEDSEHDFTSIFEIVHGSQRFKNLENRYIKKGHAGKGVFDNQTNKFYRCSLGGHWEKVTSIIEKNYPQYHDPFIMLSGTGYNEDEWEGITRKELDDFIINTFTLVGEYRTLDDYL